MTLPRPAWVTLPTPWTASAGRPATFMLVDPDGNHVLIDQFDLDQFPSDA